MLSGLVISLILLPSSQNISTNMGQAILKNLCIYCNKEVQEQQEALQCEGCDQWQNREFFTGIKFEKKLNLNI